MDFDHDTLARCAPMVAPSTMQRVLKVESGFRPHVIGYKITKDGQVYELSRQPTDKAEAIAWARYLLANGYRFDAGIAQVNSSNFSRLGLKVEDLFNACSSIRAGGQILSEFYWSAVRQYGKGQTALLAAISAYQTGSFSAGFQTGYVQRVTGLRIDLSGVGKGKGRAQASESPYEASTSVSGWNF